jgi:RNA polymerase sigma-70 factor, ECF subfamily
MSSEDSSRVTTSGTDEGLIAAHAAGDPGAFAELVRRHRDRLWTVALRTLGDPEEAADALQEAFTTAFRAAGLYRGEARVTTWLHRIVVNTCLDRIRRRHARPTGPLPEPGPPPEPRTVAEIDGLLDQSSLGTEAARALRNRASAAGVDRILQRAKDLASARDPDVTLDPPADRTTTLLVQEALAALPDNQRTPILLVDVEGYSIAETAEMLGIAEDIVKSRMARGRSKLARALAHLRPADNVEHPQR